MSETRVRTYVMDEPPSRMSLDSALPEAYRTGHPWPVYLTGIEYNDLTVLLFPNPEEESSRDSHMYGHRESNLLDETGIDGNKVRTWVAPKGAWLAEVGDVMSVIPANDLRLGPGAYLPDTVVNVNVPSTEPVNEDAVMTAEAMNTALLADVALLSRMLLEEAEEREWCSEYDTFVEEYNANAQVAKMVPCERPTTYQVTVTETVTRRIRVTRTVRRDLPRDDEAIENEAIAMYDRGQGNVTNREINVDSIVDF